MVRCFSRQTPQISTTEKKNLRAAVRGGNHFGMTLPDILLTLTERAGGVCAAASAVGVSHGTVSRWTTEDIAIPLGRFDALCDAAGATSMERDTGRLLIAARDRGML